MLFSIGAMQIDLVARAWLAFDLTGSGLALGIVTASRGLPQIVLAPFGGVAADRFDKRKLLVYSQAAVFVLASVNAALVVTGWDRSLAPGGPRSPSGLHDAIHHANTHRPCARSSL